MRNAALALATSMFVARLAWGDADVPAQAVVAELPFLAVQEPNRIYVGLGRDGAAPLDVLLDTGASFTLFTPLAARAAGVSVRAHKDTPYRRATRLGRDLVFYVDVRGGDTGSRTGMEYGLLGANFLAEFVVELDFAKRVVRLLDPKRYAVPAQVDATDEAIVPMQLTSSRPLVELRVDGHPIEVLLDTGCPTPVVLSGASAKSAGIDVDALPPFGEMRTVVGDTPIRFYEAREIEFGGKRFASMPIEVSPKGWFNQGGSSSSVIGYDLLSRFLVRIDYARKRIWLRQRGDPVTFQGVVYELMRGTGAFLTTHGDDVFVTAVLPGSPAAKLGLRAGDAVLREAAGDAHRLSLEQVMSAIRAGKPVRVARPSSDVWIDVDLPDDPLLQAPHDD